MNTNYKKDIVYADHNGDKLRNNEKWLEKESNYTENYIKSSDRLKLHVYMVNHNESSDKWAIVVHGYGGNGKLMSPKSKYFYEMVYNVLVPDLRGHGKSEGEYIGMGWKDRLDIISWINFIVKEDLPSNVKAIIADCAYTSILDAFNYELKTYLNLPSSYILTVTNIIAQLKAGYSLREGSTLDAVKNLLYLFFIFMILAISLFLIL